MTEQACQVDFYLLRTAGLDARKLACRLSMMAWERGHDVSVVVESDEQAKDLDSLMWETPSGRFLPHSVNDEGDHGLSPVTITSMTGLNTQDVVINLCPGPVDNPGRFSRLLEIVPQSGPALESSRDKFRFYRGLGITPATHEISK